MIWFCPLSFFQKRVFFLWVLGVWNIVLVLFLPIQYKVKNKVLQSKYLADLDIMFVKASTAIPMNIWTFDICKRCYNYDPPKLNGKRNLIAN